MKRIVAMLASLILVLTIPLGNMVYALDAAEGQIIEPDYIDVIEEVFPGIKDGQISPQWTSGAPDAANPKTHGYITKIALNLLRGDNASAKSFYSGYLPTLVRGSVLPDSDEITGVYAWHFYGENGKNYSGGPITAYSKCVEHYYNAVSQYRNGSRALAMETLGRALHYLQDVNVPHHAKNATAVFTNHTHFESMAENNMESYAVSKLTSDEYSDANKYVGTLVDEYANIARGWYAKASSGNTEQMLSAARSCIRNSQRATATLLYKFMLEVS